MKMTAGFLQNWIRSGMWVIIEIVFLRHFITDIRSPLLRTTGAWSHTVSEERIKVQTKCSIAQTPAGHNTKISAKRCG